MVKGWGIVTSGLRPVWWRGEEMLASCHSCNAIVFLRRQDAEAMRSQLMEPSDWDVKEMEVLA